MKNYSRNIMTSFNCSFAMCCMMNHVLKWR